MSSRQSGLAPRAAGQSSPKRIDGKRRVHQRLSYSPIPGPTYLYRQITHRGQARKAGTDDYHIVRFRVVYMPRRGENCVCLETLDEAVFGRPGVTFSGSHLIGQFVESV